MLLLEMRGIIDETARISTAGSLLPPHLQSSLALLDQQQSLSATPFAPSVPAFPPSATRADLPQIAPAAMPAAQTGLVQVQVLLGVDEQANLTAAITGAATGAAQRVVQDVQWQQGALATAGAG